MVLAIGIVSVWAVSMLILIVGIAFFEWGRRG